MLVRTPYFLALALASVALVGCSSGARTSNFISPSCDDGSGSGSSSQAMCVIACNLGCGGSGCSVTEIAQNQPISFQFSKEVDPASVNFTTVQIKTATGEEPVGEFLVSGDRVTFLPTIQVSGSSSFFGFKNGATYSLLIRKAGEGVPTVKSTSAQPMVRDVACSLRVSRGIIDLDQAPPSATLVTPATVRDVVRGTQIVVEFSEMLDTAPFQTTVENLPVQLAVRRTQLNGSTRECSTGEALPLRGAFRLEQDTARQRTVFRFTPASALPADACVEVRITTRVRDVAGTSARAQVFQFITETAVGTPRERTESFSSQQRLDVERSAGEWSGGRVTPLSVGGTGLHGDFDHTMGQDLGNGVWLWDLERDVRNGVRGFLIPETRTSGSRTVRGFTLSGQDEFVSNGEFHFARFTVPEGVTVRFRGSKPVKLFVRGRCEIVGTLDLRGDSATPGFLAKVSVPADVAGQAASPGGAGGGAGGAGGSVEATMGTVGNPNKPAFNGQNGGAGYVDATHAYAGEVANMGGRGSTQWPASGLNTDIQFTYIGVLSQMAPSPGAGGGHVAAGGVGLNRSTPASVRQPNSTGGALLDLLGRSPQGRSSLVHYLVGGSGGGGGGAHTFFRVLGDAFLWNAGGAGGGGGGALALRVGRELVTAASAVIDVRGGNGATGGTLNTGPATPGGGGSGGAVLMQVGGDYRLAGRVTALGGSGGTFQFNFGSPGVGDTCDLAGGNGSAGYVRVEALTAPVPNNIGVVEPAPTAANVGTLTDRDRVVGLQSLYYVLDDVFPPRWVRYEIEAEVDSQTVIYSDDPTFGSSVRAVPFESPVGFVIQGTRLAGDDPATPTTPWRQFVGAFDNGAGNLNADDATVYRFQLILNFNRANNINVRRVTLHYEN